MIEDCAEGEIGERIKALEEKLGEIKAGED
jgi:hypothetical protein